MLWHGQARRVSGFDENDVASALAVLDPTRLLQNSDGPLPRDGGQSCHLRRDLNLSDFNCQWHAVSSACFETTGDGLAYVIQGLGLRAPLGYAARN